MRLQAVSPAWQMGIVSLAASLGLWACGDESGSKGKVQVFVFDSSLADLVTRHGAVAKLPVANNVVAKGSTAEKPSANGTNVKLDHPTTFR